MNKLMKVVSILDAEYFADLSFIKREHVQVVSDFVEGRGRGDALNTAIEVSSWLRMDADYFDHAERAVLRQFWYLAPAIIAGFWLIKRLYRRTAKNILKL